FHWSSIFLFKRSISEYRINQHRNNKTRLILCSKVRAADGVFIDDIFIASTKDLNLDEFKSPFLYLKLNFSQDNSMSILNLYIKPTNSCNYLMPVSNHPEHQNIQDLIQNIQ
ncbi:hypothetical protein BpHYR1_028599, partial [Brachionus plicatilis]